MLLIIDDSSDQNYGNDHHDQKKRMITVRNPRLSSRASEFISVSLTCGNENSKGLRDLSQLVCICSRKLKGIKKIHHHSFVSIHLPRMLETVYHPCRGLFATDWNKLIEIEPVFREFLRISSTASHNLFRTWQQCDREQKLALREKLHKKTAHTGP